MFMLDECAAEARRVAELGERQLAGDELTWFHHGRHLNPNEAADLLGVSIEAVRRWSLFGWVRFLRLDSRSHYLYCEDDVMDLLRLCEGYGKPSARLIQARIRAVLAERRRLVSQAVPVEEIDEWRASSAGVSDALAGGRNHLKADRDLAAALAEVAPWVSSAVRSQDQFTSRALAHMAERGVRSFLHLGGGYPRARRVHELLVETPDVRAVYAEDDPLAFAHVRALLARGSAETRVVRTGLADIQRLLDCEPVQGLLAEGRPVGVLAVGLAHRFTHDRRAANALARLRDALPLGSYLAFTHPERTASLVTLIPGTEAYQWEKALLEAADLYSRHCVPVRLRTREQICRLLDGFDIPGGLTDLDRWYPPGRAVGRPNPDAPPVLAGVAFKAAPTRTRRERLTYLMDGLRRGANPPASTPATGRTTT
ncbi:hypothetical protein GCM10010468_76220 [Actinocorallia longicatena]|uniref:Uncharacterized protein n=1 Tax=Actinocorallia longicatena TaxID=111803 RepID=A0ABP6QLE6_9ACTN